MRFLLVIVCLVSFAGTPVKGGLSIEKVRQQFFASAKNKALAVVLYEDLKAHEKHLKPTLKGYLGVMEARMAEQTINPWKRYSYFSDGKNRLEEAIQLAPDNLELRFLRFVLQTQCPEFLGYCSDINTDKEVLLKGLGKATIDAGLEPNIVSYLLSSTHCTEADRTTLQTYKSQS